MDETAFEGAEQPSAPPPPPAPSGSRALRYGAATAVAVVLAVGMFTVGYVAAGILGPGAGSSCAAPSEAFAAFCEAYDLLQREYVDELDDDRLVEGALEGMFQYGVQDPYSGYMSAEEYRNAQGDLSGTFSGIGAELAVENVEDPEDLAACTTLSSTCVLVVVAPIEGSPAQAAGLQSGDVVLAVDGVSVDGTTIQDQVGRIRGPEGTDVTLTLDRDGEVSDLTITRGKIVIIEVESELLEGHIGYIALHGFSADASAQFADQLGALFDDGADQIVFDLRGNPGGYITAAQEVASEFVAEGLIFSQESGGGETKEWEATGDGQATDPDIEVVVLVDRGSASASEIVAAALDETDRATIIGEPTFGKNTVQIWDELVNGGGVRITISRWFTPDHNSVAPDGVQPDIVVKVPDETPTDEDPVLNRALEYLASVAGAEHGPAAAAGPTGALRAALDLVAWAPETGLWAAWRAC